MELRHETVDVGPVKLHCAVAEPAPSAARRAPLIVLLHGFPEYWGSWSHQLEGLARLGFRVVAPDLRGYNLSDQPQAVDAYRVERLAEDVAVLVRHFAQPHEAATNLGRDTSPRALLVGHDWGAAVAWQVAMSHPDVVERLAILSVPHPVRMKQGLRTLRQLRKSWYMFAFQLPKLPEWVLARGDYANVARAVRTRGANPQELDGYREAARRSGLTGPIHYYRSAARGVFGGWPLARIDCPVLVLWGERDLFLGKELAAPPPEWVPNARVVYFPHASHWLQRDEPEAVNHELAVFAGVSPAELSHAHGSLTASNRASGAHEENHVGGSSA
jgi:pimeloyl-ACP methyl ester carboxylesterase